MGNKCCSKPPTSEDSFYKIYSQRFIKDSSGLDIITQTQVQKQIEMGRYTVQCGPKQVAVLEDNNTIAQKSVYEVLCIINEVISNQQDVNHRHFATENLMSFFRINLHLITSSLIAESLLELLNDPVTNPPLIALLQKQINDPYSEFSHAQMGNNINDERFQDGAHDRWRGQNEDYNNIEESKIQQIQNPTHQPQNSQIISNQHIPDDSQIKSPPPASLNQSTQQFNEVYQESEVKNYKQKVTSNANAIYKSSMQASQIDGTAQPILTEDDPAKQQLISKLIKDSQGIVQPDDMVMQEMNFAAEHMGGNQLELINHHEQCQIWRVFDAYTGNMNYQKKQNFNNFGKNAVKRFLKEVIIMRNLQSIKPPITTALQNIVHNRAEIQFEGGASTLWEAHVEMARSQSAWHENDLIYLLLELTQAVNTLKKIGIYHNNICPRNVVLVQTASSKYQARLINFENASLQETKRKSTGANNPGDISGNKFNSMNNTNNPNSVNNFNGFNGMNSINMNGYSQYNNNLNGSLNFYNYNSYGNFTQGNGFQNNYYLDNSMNPMNFNFNNMNMNMNNQNYLNRFINIQNNFNKFGVKNNNSQNRPGNSTLKLWEQDPRMKTYTEAFVDLSLRFKQNSELTSSELYSVGRTILALLISPNATQQAILQRKNNPIVYQTILQNVQPNYPKLVPILQKLLRISLSQFKLKSQPILQSSNSNLSESLSLTVSINEIDADLQEYRDKAQNGTIPNFILDQKGIINQIRQRRADLGAWVEDMDIAVFKKEIMHSLVMSKFERGCDLCNYILGYFPQKTYSTHLITKAAAPNNPSDVSYQVTNVLAYCFLSSLFDILANFQTCFSFFQKQIDPLASQNTAVGQPQIILPELRRARKQRSQPFRRDDKKYVSIEHEFYVKAETVCKELYSGTQLNDILRLYFEVKERLSLYFQRAGLLVEGASVCEQLIMEKNSLAASEQASLANTYITLANLYLQQEYLPQAEKQAFTALGLLHQVYPDSMHLDVAKALVMLAKISSKRESHKQAVQAANLASIIASTVAPDTLDLAGIAEAFGEIYMKASDDPGRAVAQMELAVKIKMDCFADSFLNPSLDEDILRLASCYEQLRNYQLAFYYYNKLLEIRQTRLLEPGNQKQLQINEIAQAHTLLAFSLEKLNDNDNALIHHEKAKALRKEFLGENNIDVANSLINVSVVQMRKGRFQEALIAQNQALSIKQKIVPESADTAQSMNNLGIIYETVGNFQEAIACHEGALNIKLRIYGEKSNPVTTSYNNLALTYKNSGKPGKALEMALKALAIRRELNAPPEELVPILTNIAAIQTDIGNIQEIAAAREELRQASFLVAQKQQSQKQQQAIQEEMLFRSANPTGSLLAYNKTKNSIVNPNFNNINNLSINNNRLGQMRQMNSQAFQPPTYANSVII